ALDVGEGQAGKPRLEEAIDAHIVLIRRHDYGLYFCGQQRRLGNDLLGFGHVSGRLCRMRPGKARRRFPTRSMSLRALGLRAPLGTRALWPIARAAGGCQGPLAATAARAEEGPMPEEIAWKLLEIGRVIDPPKTAAIYAPLQEKEPYPGAKIERDVKYGAADRNRLDIFMPETASSPRPVLIFVHGGAFVTGDKRVRDGPFYDNIMLWAVKNGFVGVNVDYRLAPQASWPAGAKDLA